MRNESSGVVSAYGDQVGPWGVTIGVVDRIKKVRTRDYFVGFADYVGYLLGTSFRKICHRRTSHSG